MKSKIKIIAIIACLTVGYFLHTKNQVHELNDLILENVEALANDENTSYRCFGSGSVDCHGYNVKYKIENYNLK